MQKAQKPPIKNMLKKTTLGISLTAFTLGILIFGYSTSDQQKINEIIAQQKISTVNEAFSWLTENYHQVDQTNRHLRTNRLLGARELLEKSKGALWCDEGALILGQIANNLGHEYRLTDLRNESIGVSHHTTLEIMKEGKWMTYDFSSKQIYEDPRDSVLKNPSKYPTYTPVPVSRRYPSSLIQWLLNRSGQLRYVQQLQRDFRKQNI